MIQDQPEAWSFRPEPVIGTRTVSSLSMAPASISFESPARAAAEVGSQKRPSVRASRDCQDVISESGTERA